ncbi:hypothetical protein MMC24_006392 [Lignoscripta atroalba]|nr:hypothetical protein [Lignoscripta atroalba]
MTNAAPANYASTSNIDSTSIPPLDPSQDPDKQIDLHTNPSADKADAVKSLGLLDRFLALWIFLAMVVRVLLGNFVPNTGPALQRGSPWVSLFPSVLILTGLAGGDNEYCAILVAVNSILQMVLYAPLALLFIKVISRGDDNVTISYLTVAKSVAAFLGIPLGAAIITRFSLRKFIGQKWYDETSQMG